MMEADESGFQIIFACGARPGCRGRAGAATAEGGNKDRIIAEKDQALSAAEAIIQQLKEALRAERVARYGKRSEKLSDLQFQLLDLEPGVSSDEIEREVASGPLPECPGDTQENHKPTEKQQRARRNHPGRNELPAHLERVEQIIACTAEQCACGKCGKETSVIGYERPKCSTCTRPSIL